MRISLRHFSQFVALFALVWIVLSLCFRRNWVNELAKQEIPITTGTSFPTTEAPMPDLTNLLPSNCSGRVPCIGFGTPYFTWKDWMFYVRQFRQSAHATCGVECEFTSVPDAADVVLFHDRDLPQHISLRHHPNQRWIYINMESPLASKANGFGDLRFAFNMTATTMLSSDIHVPYGMWRRRSKPLPSSTRFYNSTKKRFAAFIAFSNCKTPNNRQEKVKQLQKYMEVHVYGKCGDRQAKSDWEIWPTLSVPYRFYLSFENAFCRDYITEKFHNNGLNSQAVPVVFGGLSRLDYERVSPPNSFIYANDFSTMKALADHLNEVAKDEKKYAQYFEWKRQFETSPEAAMMCQVCQRLHAVKGHKIADLSEFTNSKKNCRPPEYRYLV